MTTLPDGQLVTDCCGAWPVARTPHAQGWQAWRYCDTAALMASLRAVAVWVALGCVACGTVLS